jgi:hypothetical protein
MSEITVPPGVRFQFEQRAQEVCELAKIDYGDQAQIVSEMTQLMEERWRTLQVKLTTDDAMIASLESFGSAGDVASAYRGGFKGYCHRLIYYRRYSLHRMVAPIIFCLFHNWLRTSGSLQVHVLSSKDLEWRFVLYGWDYYIGVISLVTIIVVRMIADKVSKPDPSEEKAIELHTCFQIAGFAVVLFLFADIATEWIHSVSSLLDSDWRHMAGLDNVARWEELMAIIVYIGAFLFEAFFFFPMLGLVGAEIFDMGERKKARRKREQQRVGN